MTTVGQLSTRVKAILDELTITVDSITNSYNNMNTRETSSDSISSVTKQSEIKSLNAKADAANKKFEQAQYKFKASGGKSRKQTLQEFVILFFFVAYAAFTVSLILYGAAVGVSTLKIFGVMAFALLMISGIIIRYA
jgi:negative regulator of genetic competence, sporulation and motility